MAKGKKQYRTISGGGDIDQVELLGMFQQLTGDPGKLDPEIVKDKYERLKNDIERCNKLVMKFKEAILDRLHTKIGVDVYFGHEVNRIVEFVNQVNEYLDVEITDENLIHIYQALKDTFAVEEYFEVCKVLRQDEDCIKDRCSLSDKFIRRSVDDGYSMGVS